MTEKLDLDALKALIAADPDPVYLAAFDTLKKGAPGLSERSCAALSRSIALKVKHGAAARTALPGLVEMVEAQQKAFAKLVGYVLCAQTSNTREYMAGLADEINAAVAVFGDQDRVAFERGGFHIARAALKGDQA